MKYITHRRFKGNAICGQVNIPALTTLESANGVIMLGERALCYEQSENAHQFFAQNEDGEGLMRGQLTQAIQKTLARRDNQYQERWDRVWDDPVCQKYKRADHEDHWLWNHDWFQADIDTLRHIAALVGAKEV